MAKEESSTEQLNSKSSKDEAATLRAKDVSPLRRKLKLPSTVIKSSLKKVSSAEKTQVRASPSSSRVKHLIATYSKKIGGMRNFSGHASQDRIGITAPPPNHRDSSAKVRGVKLGANSASLTPLEVRMVTTKKVRESSTQRRVHQKCVQLVQRLISPTPQGMHLSELEKKNVDLTGKLSIKQIRHETKMSEMKAYFHLKRKNVDIFRSYDKLLAKFDTYHKAVERSKSKIVIGPYKSDHLDYKNGLLLVIILKMKMSDFSVLTCPILKAAGSAEQMAAYDEHAAKLCGATKGVVD
ncbi:hypothetical protein L3X38_033064 [Prunus dulcis]|uniref:Uncharacterized protein n=1 Tax=Prunus dulcis TaxID=3755 RepID=A0AAD4YWG7_PRUDU|nr:hypothetical protein L3X38_033064 [Prunus dulcis]